MNESIKAALATGTDTAVSMRFVFNFLVKEVGEAEGRNVFEWYCSTYNLSIADNANATIKREVFGLYAQYIKKQRDKKEGVCPLFYIAVSTIVCVQLSDVKHTTLPARVLSLR